ncbi:MAG: DoxX family membrane protein [Deltaproteobacteria bacterium]|nr:DoxX family membrane protein [Deltaproteobacteria bacterium]
MSESAATSGVSSSCAVTRFLEGPIVQIAARLALAAIFFYAAIPKIGDPAAFARDIANYRLVPEEMVSPAAVMLPWIELVTALCLALGVLTRGAALVCAVLLAAFTAATTAAVLRGLNIECGCFGQSGSGNAVGWGTVVRDAAFLVPAVLVVLFDRGRYGLAKAIKRP